MYIKNKRIVELVRTLSSDKRYYITSVEFAKIVGKQHRNVLRDIRQEIQRLEEDGRNISDLVTESNYANSCNSIQPAFKISATGILHMTMRYGRYSYQLRYDLIELADWLKSGVMFYDNDYSCFKK